MKNRKGTIHVQIIFALIILALLAVLWDTRILHGQKNCVKTLQLMPTLQDSMKFYHIQPSCINITPTDTI